MHCVEARRLDETAHRLVRVMHGCSMKLYALSDLHLSYAENRQALAEIAACPNDWLILGGDIGESRFHLELACETLLPRFRKLIWVPGNHEMWTLPSSTSRLSGLAKYEQFVEVCRSYGVLTPEDPYPVVSIGAEQVRIVPLFLLYDYSFRPDDVPLESAVAWAAETGVYCADEKLLRCEPYVDVAEWCVARCRATEARLQKIKDGVPTVLINHFPLRRDLAWLPRIPRFSIWCGTRQTEDWHVRFNAAVVVSGHLHIRSTTYRDGVRFEEVSLGYPRQWKPYTTVNACVRQIMPHWQAAEKSVDHNHAGNDRPFWPCDELKHKQ